VSIARREEDPVWQEGHSILGHQRFPMSDGAELPSEHRHERDRQMLRDQDRHSDALGQGTKQNAEGMNAARRCTDRKHIDRVVRHRSKEGLYGPRRLPRSVASVHLRMAERLQLPEQDFGKSAIEAAGAGLRKSVSSAERERGNRALRPILRQRGDDHHLRSSGCRYDPWNGLEPACSGHFEIEDDDVDSDLVERVDRILRRTCDRSDLEGVVAFDHAR
jgi:hypothetical protein